jgi:hypothetical protein
MLAPPSLQNNYSLCFSGDPALELPEAEDAKILALKNARERGQWPVKQGEKVTHFHFRQVGGSAVRWWYGESQRQSLSPLEDIELMFRLALVSVDGIEIKHDKRGKFPLVSIESMDLIYASGAGPAAVTELGAIVAERSLGGVPPL